MARENGAGGHSTFNGRDPKPGVAMLEIQADHIGRYRRSTLPGTNHGSRAELVPLHRNGASVAFDTNDATSCDELQRHTIV